MHEPPSVVDERRLSDELRQAEAAYRAFAGTMPGNTWTAAPSGELTFIGDYWQTLDPVLIERALGFAWLDAVHDDDRERVRARWAHSVATGEPYECEFRVLVAEGVYHWYRVRSLPIRDEHGEITSWVGLNLDINDQYEAERMRRRVEEGLRLLSRTGAAVVDSLDYQRTLTSIAQAFVGGFAAFCVIDVMPATGGWERTIAHPDPASADILRGVSPPRGNHPLARAIHARESSVVTVDDAWAKQLDLSTDRGEAARALKMRSLICVPVVTPAGEVVGGIACGLDDTIERDNYEPADLVFVEEVARRAGAAIANVREYQRERRVAIELQAAALPSRLPTIDGVGLDAAYRPGSAEALIGGDWYDAFLVDDGRLVMTAGDVLGHGLHAAVSMTKLRLAMQSAAMVDAEPHLMLHVADATLRVSDPDAYATAIAAVYDPRTRRLEVASAGHPRPLVRTADGNIQEIPVSGSMIGLRRDEPREVTVVDVAAETRVIFYTDGLIEFTHDQARGLQRLVDAIGSDLLVRENPCAERLVDAVLAGEHARDDIAVLIAAFA
jgi:PAS domain S-box-containing protein